VSGSQRHSVAEVARILGISERGVRDRIERGTLDAVKQEGQRGWRILLPPDAVVHAVGTTASGGSPRGSEAVGGAVATPALVEAAIQRTGQQYTTDLRTMLTELREVYEGQIEAKDTALAAKDETIAELRRRAEVAEAALSERSDKPAQAAQAGPRSPETPIVVEEAAPGVWGRLRRWWVGRGRPHQDLSDT